MANLFPTLIFLDFFGREDYDASVFRATFGQALPLLGCYCGGEIGPTLLAGVDRLAASLFATTETRCAVQVSEQYISCDIYVYV